MNDEMLKDGRSRYFREWLQRIRDIRSSERNFYLQVTDLFATAVDYDKNSQITKEFYAAIQNKLHYAVHKHTAAEIVYDRADNKKPAVGMTNFKGNYVTKDDVKIAKNYLDETELNKLNLLVSGFLDYAEFHALQEKPIYMKEWIKHIDNEIQHFSGNPILIGKGRISHEQAIAKAEKEFEVYRAREMKTIVSDFEKVVAEYSRKNKKP